MKREIIAIADNGIVTVPDSVRMTIIEIANLFGIYYQTAKRHIRAIEKSGVTEGDYSMSCASGGSQVYPDYYGLEMIIAVAFRIRSHNADLFRRWLIRKVAIKMSEIQTFVCWNSDSISLN